MGFQQYDCNGLRLRTKKPIDFNTRLTITTARDRVCVSPYPRRARTNRCSTLQPVLDNGHKKTSAIRVLACLDARIDPAIYYRDSNPSITQPYTRMTDHSSLNCERRFPNRGVIKHICYVSHTDYCFNLTEPSSVVGTKKGVLTCVSARLRA